MDNKNEVQDFDLDDILSEFHETDTEEPVEVEADEELEQLLHMPQLTITPVVVKTSETMAALLQEEEETPEEPEIVSDEPTVVFAPVTEKSASEEAEEDPAVLSDDTIAILFPEEEAPAAEPAFEVPEEFIPAPILFQPRSRLKELKKKLESLNAKMASGKVDDVLSGKVEIGGITVVAGRVDGLGGNDLRNLGDSLKEKIGTGIAVLASCADDKIAFLATATPDAVKMGVHAGMVIKEITKIAGGSGGGKPDMAQGGGKDASKIEEALGTVCKVVESQLK